MKFRKFAYIILAGMAITSIAVSPQEAAAQKIRETSVPANSVTVSNSNTESSDDEPVVSNAPIYKLPDKNRKNPPFVVPASPINSASRGMEGDIIALWHSHGRYYKPGHGWAWQRPFLFETAEDVYTMSYVLPFLVPMLENAGSYVMLPRERDINKNEVIVDNDKFGLDGGPVYSQTTYKEENGSKKWVDGEEEGFIYDIPTFRDTENPFEAGTYRQVEAVKGGKSSTANWYADIPEDGEYAVYVSYKSFNNSIPDAHYTVNYSGGSKDFRVNQQMGGGTWIYLGTFPLRAGYSDKTPVVSLSNQTDRSGNFIVTADAIKIGGGMGNIERSAKRSDVYYDYEDGPLYEEETIVASVNPEDEDIDINDMTNTEVEEGKESKIRPTSTPVKSKKSGAAPKFTTSGLPRFLEGARYWLQWAGIPESVYSPFHGTDDYKDDYTARGHWVNYLAGGSRVLPNKEGLGIPVDLSFALHTDAGMRNDDSIVGTLGICYTNNNGKYTDGTPRSNSRTLTSMLQDQIVKDIRQTFEPNWTRRQIWDKSYLEARVAEVPTSLIELLSHQNFGDMQYGLDPAFRFTVSRAIYKAMGRFLAQRKGREFVVQPLPVKNFAITRVKKGEYRLQWEPTEDRLEPSAKPTKYIIFERQGGHLGFNKIKETTSTSFDVTTKDNNIHSFYVVAANAGGVSFPSEILAFREGNDNKPVLIINGFSRVSAPAHYSSGGKAGFQSKEDFGVPYKYDISFTGYQNEFSRSAGQGFGKSGSDQVSTVVGGNTFDYPAVHGEAIAHSGRGFVSVSAGAVEAGKVKLSDYKVIDLILGKQKKTVTGKGSSGVRFESVPEKLQAQLEKFLSNGGRILVSGSNVSSDLYDIRSTEETKDFAYERLGIDESTKKSTSRSGKLNVSSLPGTSINLKSVNYANTLRPDFYIVESADVLYGIPEIETRQFLSFSDTGETAGLVGKIGKSSIAVMSVPFESIISSSDRDALMKGLLDWLEK